MLLSAVVLAHVLLHALAAWGCGVLLHAARRERRGDLGGARRTARRGGFVMAGATLGTAASGPAVLAVLDPPARLLLLGSATETVLLTACSGLTVLAGFVGLLAGLSGKPRPGGYVAALIYVTSAGGVLAISLG